MNEAQIEVVFQQLFGLGCRPPKQLSTPQGLRFAVKTWAAVLADVPPDQMQIAVLRYSRSPESRWWPTPGVLVGLIEDANRASDDNADEMWGRLVGAVSSRGRSRPPTEEQPLHPDAAINQKMLAGVEACGGWRNLCVSTHRELMANRAAFRGAYEARQKAQDTQRQIQATTRLLSTSTHTAISQEDHTKEQ